MSEQKSALTISDETINQQVEELVRLAHDIKTLQALKTNLEKELPS